MVEDIKKISLLSKIFNIQRHEWPKVGISWLMRFLYRAGFVIGWTIIVGMFTAKYGIKALPYLFFINAALSVFGSLIYSTLLDRYSKQIIMIVTIFLAGVLLFLGTIFAKGNDLVFFGLLLVAEAVFLIQFRILMDGFIEEMFTPLESERAFPLIEAAETFAGILAGTLIISLSSSIETFRFVYVWIGTLFLIVPCLLFYENLVAEVNMLKKGEEKEKSSLGFLKKIRNELGGAKHLSFIKILLLVILLQWVLYNLVEFQYMKAVYQNVAHVVLEGGSGFEHALVHDLGILFTLFSGFALLIQLFLGGRMIKSLGIVGTMILHPVVTVLSLVGMFWNFGFYSAVLAKNNFNVTTILFTNAYHSSYYAVKEHVREHVREFLEGIVRPVGALLGTGLLIVIQLLVSDARLVLAVNVTLLAVTLLFLTLTTLMQDKYTKAALADLKNEKDRKLRMNAIDILAQRGHRSALPELTEILLDKHEPPAIRLHVLKAFGELQDMEAVKEIMACFKSDISELRNGALDALYAYGNFEKKSEKFLYLRYQLVEELKNLYQRDRNELARSKIVTLLGNLSSIATLEFLSHVLKTARGTLKADAIAALGKYEDKAVTDLVLPYLKSKDKKQRINAAVALGRIGENEDEALFVIDSFLHASGKPEEIALGLYAVGELKIRRKKKLCYHY
ncbi:MAG: HEAT repeat domain-containing protein, partial [Candidatus Gracilibacteria bacterium]